MAVNDPFADGEVKVTFSVAAFKGVGYGKGIEEIMDVRLRDIGHLVDQRY